MDNLNNNLTITKNIDPTHIFEALPKEITVKILGYLEKKDLFAICSTCKRLNEIADSSPLWKKEIEFLWKKEIEFYNIHVEKYIEKYIELNISIRTTVGKRIMLLRRFAKRGDKLLDKEVKTAFELDRIGFQLLMIGGKDDALTFLNNQHREEVNRKLLMSESLDVGFDANIQLKQLGLKGMDILEKYAAVMLKYYGSGEEAWGTVALEYISENNPERALEIVNKELNGLPRQTGDIIEGVVAYYAQRNLFHKAIEVVKLYKETHEKFEENRHLHHCCTMILSWAKNSKDFIVIEELIDTCLPEQDKFQKVTWLIKKILDRKHSNEANRLFVKYANVIAFSKNKLDVHRAINLYVRLGHIDLAWEIALKHQEKDTLLLRVLRNAFSSANLTEEEEKVQKMIDNNK